MGEYVCIAERHAGREDMTVRIENRGDPTAPVGAFEALLKTRLGVEIAVELAAPGALAELTQIERRQKPIRLIDRRADGT